MLESPVDPKAAKIMMALACLLVGFCLLHIMVGAYINYSPAEIVTAITKGPASLDTEARVFWWTRLPRATGVLLIGCSLGLAGSAMQGVFRNPLADPYITGSASGAAVGGVLAFLAPLPALELLTRPVFAMVTSGAALALVLALAPNRKQTTELLLSGVVVGSFLSAFTSFLLLHFGKDTNQVLRWLLGDTSSMFWPRIAVIAVALAICFWPLLKCARALNALSLGSEVSDSLGFDSAAMQRTALGLSTVLVAVVVGSVGIIPFVGLVAPHIARRLLGPDWRLGLPSSALVGGALLLAADLFAQRLNDIPVGLITAMLGAPALLVMLRAGRRVT